MTDDEIFEEDDDYIVVEFTDDDGNVYPYVQEMVIPVEDDNFALLVPLREGEEHGEGCECGCESGEDDDVVIAKMVEGEDGAVEYIEPTDEEFQKVEEAYEALFDDEEE